ncbi:MAG: hypothetical protein ABR999_07150 [Methanoregula sp.]|jgi:hypothetical protein
MGYSMVDITSYILIGITCFCFGLIVSSRIAPIQYCRKLTLLVRRSISTKTIALVLAEYEAMKARK